MMKHPSIWLALCALTAFSAAHSIVLTETTKQPNIVLLISDDDDYEHFGFMGSKIAQTPTLDKLVANGTLFTTFRTSCPFLLPLQFHEPLPCNVSSEPQCSHPGHRNPPSHLLPPAD